MPDKLESGYIAARRAAAVAGAFTVLVALALGWSVIAKRQADFLNSKSLENAKLALKENPED